MTQSFDLIVIGAGPGGYVAALRGAQLGLKTACIDKQEALGGTCLNVGCIPSKALLYTSELYDRLKREGASLGIVSPSTSCDLEAMMRRKEKIVSGFNAGIQGLFRKNKISFYCGAASLTAPHTVSVKTSKEALSLEGRFIVIATGSEPSSLPFLPFDEKQILSSTGALALKKIPKSLLVVGAGVIGVELGSVYQRLGTQVTFLEFLDRICPTLDPALSQELQRALTNQGMTFHLKTQVAKASLSQDLVTLESADGKSWSAENVLVAVGRKPHTNSLGLETVGIATDKRGFIPIDGCFRTSLSHVFAIGDVVEGPMLAHKASEEGVAVAEIIAGKSPLVQYATIPNVVYTHPEVAAVGLTEEEARQLGLTPRIGLFPFKANSRARCTGDEGGFVKIVTEAKSDKIIGVHIIGAHASELIGEATAAIVKGATAEDIANTCHAHPTLSEALKEACLAVHQRALHS